MKMFKIIFLMAVFALVGNAWSALYLNVYVGDSYLFLEQSEIKCDPADGKAYSFSIYQVAEDAKCFDNSEPIENGQDVYSELVKLLDRTWLNPMNVGGIKKLSLQSDLDLMGFDENTKEGECEYEFRPLKSMNSIMSFENAFDGGSRSGFTIKNLCISRDVSSEDSQEPVGFFSEFSLGYVQNVKFQNVRIVVKDSSKVAGLGAKLPPVGIIAGLANHSLFEFIELENVYIEAPFSGGIVGYAKASSIVSVASNGSVKIVNKMNVPFSEDNYPVLPKTWFEGKSVFLGGIVGMAVGVEINNINLNVDIQDLSENSLSDLGGLAGIYSYSKSAFECHNDTIQDGSIIRGGSAMGAFFGETSYIWTDSEEGEFDLLVDTIKIDGVDFENTRTDDVYVGGLTGKVNLYGHSMKIKDGNMNVSLRNSISGNEYYAGGVVGFIDSLSGASFDLERLYVNGSLYVSDRYENVYLGGVVGASSTNLNGSITFNKINVVGLSDTLMYMDAGVFKKGDYVAMGGLCGSCSAVDFVNMVSISGILRMDSSNFNADSLKVGGLFGNLETNVITIENTNTIGSMSAAIATHNTPQSGFRAGYLAGNAVVKNMDKTIFNSNYHYGITETVHMDAFGNINGSVKPSAVFASYYGNVRNGDSDNLLLYGDGLPNNGWMSVDAMHSASFATMLNEIQENDVWVYQEGEYNNLPFIHVRGWKSGEPIKMTRPDSNCTVDSTGLDINVICTVISSSSSNMGESSAAVSSSSHIAEFSSAATSSAGELPGLSSSSRGNGGSAPKITMARVDVAGNAARLVFVPRGVNFGDRTFAYAQVSNSLGYLKDTIFVDSVTKNDSLYELVLAPLPAGELRMCLTLNDGYSADSFTTTFVIKNEIAIVPQAWRMMSISLMDKISLLKDATLYWWDENIPVGDYWQYRAFKVDDQPVRNRGYWYSSQKDSVIVFKDDLESSEKEIVWKLDSVFSGWNLVANPYGWYVDLNAGSGGKVTFWRWNAEIGDYEIPSILGPYEAVWASVDKPVVWTMPSKPVFDLENKAGAQTLLKKSSSDNLNVRISLSDKYGKKDSWNVIGIGSRVESQEEPPDGMGNHVSLSIVEGNKYLAKSVKVGLDEMDWTLEVSASTARDGYLKFEGMENLSNVGMHLYVIVDGQTTEVGNGEPVKVNLTRSAKRISVHMSRNEIIANEGDLHGFHAVQMGHGVNVRFVASDKMVQSMAKVELINANGELISLKNMNVRAGQNTVNLNVPKLGVYYVRVMVGKKMIGGMVALR